MATNSIVNTKGQHWTESLGEGKVYFRPSGLKLTGSYTVEDVRSLVGRLVQINNASKIWIGDAIVAGEDKFGEQAAQITAVSGLEYGTIANYTSTARAVPPEVRPNAVIAMRVFAAVAPLASYPGGRKEQERLLAMVAFPEDPKFPVTADEVRDWVWDYRANIEAAPIKNEIQRSEFLADAKAKHWTIDQLKLAVAQIKSQGYADQEAIESAEDTDPIATLTRQEAIEAGYLSEEGQSGDDGEIRTLRANLALLASKWEVEAIDEHVDQEILTAFLTCAAELRRAIGFDKVPERVESVESLEESYIYKDSLTTLAAEQESPTIEFDRELGVVDLATGEILEPEPPGKGKKTFPKKYRDAVYDALASVCKLDKTVHSGRLGKNTTKILTMGKDAEAVLAFKDWWRKNHWKGKKGQHPTPEEIVDNLIAASEVETADGSRFITGKYGNEIAH